MIDHDCGTLEIASAQSLMDPCGATAYKRCVYNYIKYILVNWSVLHDMHFHRNESSRILILDPVGAAFTLGYCNVVQLQQARKRGAEKCKSMFLNLTQPYSSWLKPIAKIQEAIAWTQLSVLQAILTFLLDPLGISDLP